MTYRQHVAPRHAVPQPLPLSGQIPNNAGGWFHALDDWTRLDRFLLLGAEGGTYHVGEQRLTRANAQAAERCLAMDGPRVVRRVVEISASGRAPKNDPALFVLAMAAAAGDGDTRHAALDAVPQVARTGTHVLTFAADVEGFRGWGRGLRRATARWFTGQDPRRLALQAVKYGQRGGWAMRDLLRLAHPLTDRAETRALFDWIAHPDLPEAIAAARGAFPLIDGLYEARAAGSAIEVAQAVRTFRLPREAVPTGWLTHPLVWEALLADMPATALLRTLGRLSAVGLLTTRSQAERFVLDRLADGAGLRGARVHPVQILLALKTYAQGHGERGRLTWTPVPSVIEALEAAFERSFDGLEPSLEPGSRRVLVAVDVSGSMHWTACAGSPALSALEAGAAMAMQLARTEPDARVVAFDTAVHPAAPKACRRLGETVRWFGRWQGGTDVAAPLRYAAEERRMVDAFVIVTDNETWAGREHPVQALAAYRRRVNPSAKAVVLAVAANQGSVVPEDDPLAFGAAGFDASVPRLVADFLRS